MESPIERAQRIVADYFGRPGAPRISSWSKDNCAYDPNNDTVLIAESKDSPALSYSRLFHEMAHSTGTRLGRSMKISKKDNPAFSRQYAIEELIAELTSVTLMASVGLLDGEIEERSREYLQSWLYGLCFSSGDPSDVHVAFEKSQVAAEFILPGAAKAKEFAIKLIERSIQHALTQE